MLLVNLLQELQRKKKSQKALKKRRTSTYSAETLIHLLNR